MAVHYKLAAFEGPLDLLLHLVDQAEVNLQDIAINEITDQYIVYLQSMQELELDVTSEFLVMAATLLSIKSAMLLPKPPPIEIYGEEDYGPDPREELIAKLIEYRKYKNIAEVLRDKELARSLIFTREPGDLSLFVPEDTSNPVEGLHVADLIVAFQKALRNVTRRNRVTRIRRDEISVKDRMLEITGLLALHEGKLLFSRLLDEDMVRADIVVTFLALLELMKINTVSCYQHNLFDEIVIHAKGDLSDSGIFTDEIDY